MYVHAWQDIVLGRCTQTLHDTLLMKCTQNLVSKALASYKRDKHVCDRKVGKSKAILIEQNFMFNEYGFTVPTFFAME
jgi:hypothetical protein